MERTELDSDYLQSTSTGNNPAQHRPDITVPTYVEPLDNKLTHSERISEKITKHLQTSRVQFILTMLLQIAAFAVTVAFGIFAVWSVKLGNEANLCAEKAFKQSELSNRQTIVTLCLSQELRVDLKQVRNPVL
ncbi:hypothetical protein B0J11DRAFT_578230 [Dendryphion nanum]|uniref:Uncharacterized protein n=1 Tax=Dendryphion nanum TaxID=256645 RepID=A0A9P9E1U1_9PLEO|nr:hypothetical protein B0J11DRAFT_578230 [Dendryphion nanum]